MVSGFMLLTRRRFFEAKGDAPWLDVGDKNNKTFHRAIKTRQTQNMIREIRCGNGSVVKQRSEIKKKAEEFYSKFLNHIQVSYTGVAEEELQEVLKFCCSMDDCQLLEAEVFAEEIRRVLFAMPNNKSPGPDGYPCEFYKTTWSVISHDFLIAVQSVFRFG